MWQWIKWALGLTEQKPGSTRDELEALKRRSDEKDEELAKKFAVMDVTAQSLAETSEELGKRMSEAQQFLATLAGEISKIKKAFKYALLFGFACGVVLWAVAPDFVKKLIGAIL